MGVVTSDLPMILVATEQESALLASGSDPPEEC